METICRKNQTATSSEVRINPLYPKSTVLRNLLARTGGEGRSRRPRRQPAASPAGLAWVPGTVSW